MYSIKGIQCEFYKLGLKVAFCPDKNDGISHFAELGSSWSGELKTCPKIALRVRGRAEKYRVGGRAGQSENQSWLTFIVAPGQLAGGACVTSQLQMASPIDRCKHRNFIV